MTWNRLAFAASRPILHALEPEHAHRLTLAALKSGLVPRSGFKPCPALSMKVLGLNFPNPVGLAAGFDKNAEVPAATLALGFGFVEVGTVTPRPQVGNPQPRLFRLREDEAVINRMGFNNEGHEAVAERLTRAGRGRGIIGVNIGANKDAADRIADYVAGYRRFAALGDYVTVNISSPNTPGLRNLQGKDELGALLAQLRDARSTLAGAPPLLVKIAPDLSARELEEIAAACLAAQVDGVIISNTTVSRPKLRSQYAGEAGGLSGAPLFDLATRQLARFYLATNGQIPLIGVGGISDAETAWAKICAGASLLQIYTALVFRGPAVIDDILAGLAARLRTQAYGALEEAVGCGAEALAQGSSGT